jgi:myo-inositol-1(or 4)-monophosphatase
MLEPIINIAVSAARAAGNIIIRSLDRVDTLRIAEKNPSDFVTEIDQAAEQEIINLIKKSYPSHSILAEESGETKGDDFTWIIDPLDGTRNFIHGFPHFAVSIAVSYKGQIEHGVIYDPLKQELFTATRGRGAQLNSRRIRVSKRTQLEQSLLSTGFPYRHSAVYQEAQRNVLNTLIPISGDVRRTGSAALDLAYVANGRFEGFWELGLKIWDLAAGVLLIKEAGGLVCDIHGGEDYLKSGNVVAGNPNVLKSLLKVIGPHMDGLD